MNMRAKQAVWFHFIFHHQFTRWCWFGGSCTCCPAGELDLLAQGGLWAQEVSLAAVCPEAVLSPHWWPLCGWGGTQLPCETMPYVTGEGQGGVATLFLVSRLQGGGWGCAVGGGCCSGCSWAGHLLFSGSSSMSYLWQAHSNLACFLLAGWFFMHLVSRKELAWAKISIELLQSCLVARGKMSTPGGIASRALPPAGFAMGQVHFVSASRSQEDKLHWNSSNTLSKPFSWIFKLRFLSTWNIPTGVAGADFSWFSAGALFYFFL